MDNYLAVSTPEGRYRLLVESISDYAIYLLDPQGTVVNWNLGAQRFKGYTAEEIVGRNFAAFYSTADQAEGVPARNLQLAAEHGRFEEEGWRYRKDGSRFWASVVIDRIIDPSGKIAGYAKITRDLTERRAQQLALKRSEEQFRLLVKGVTDYALFMLDTDGNVASWNAGAERIKGYSEDEIVGHHFSAFYTRNEREAGIPQRNLEMALTQGSLELEGIRVRKDGSEFRAHVVIDAIYDENGTLVGFAKVTRDITERHESQKKLEKAREALFQSQKMEAIGQLTGGVAHDFNNLLMAVLGSLEIVMKRMSPDPKITPFLENAVRAAQRGADLTQSMLTFARRQELVLGEVAICDTVRGMWGIMERALGPRFQITARLPQVLPAVHTDKVQLDAALLNLVVNARDAMPSGGLIVISAELRAGSRPNGRSSTQGDYVVLSVTDQGEGMDTATLARAAEPFFTTKGAGKGTGLGLSMVHGLAEQSGGSLVLYSTKGEGTTAELWLPLARAIAKDAAGSEILAPATTSTAYDTKRLLVVDDDPLVLLNTVTMAEELGHRVFEAMSGAEALAILEREQIDLLITDYAMPNMSGGELATQAVGRWPQTKVLVATGYAEMPADYKGKFERLSKPFLERDLKAAIDRLF